MIRDYAAAQQDSPSPSHLFLIAAGFLLGGFYLIYRQRQWKQEPPRLGQSVHVPFAQKAYLVCGWVCAVFGTIALITAVGVAATN
ncbi:hypothetical protein ACQFX6_17470 [Streptomyces sp. DSM 41987]|uniref:hypothetical protein n=1 Tax=Streptomyces TaxID=1883 RepID=UPI0018DF31CB|nr:hypothetical protein [Streptomyces fildesensis]